MIQPLPGPSGADETILFAGYGMLRDPEVVQAILGHEPKVLGDVAMCDVELRVQELGQIPDDILPVDAPIHQSPRQAMIDRWEGADRVPTTPVIVPKAGSRVPATLFEVGVEDRLQLAAWDLVNYGVQQPIEVAAKLLDNSVIRVQTDGLRESQNTQPPAEYRNIVLSLAPPQATIEAAERMHNKAA